MRLLRRSRRSWRQGSFGVVDFEATGLDLIRDHVVSYGFVPIEDGRACMAGALYRVVRPPVPVPAESIRVHGIRPGDLTAAPLLDDVGTELIDALEGRTLVAYAAEIEVAFLDRLCRQLGRPRPRSTIDVLALAAADSELGPPRSSGLANLAERYGVPVARTHHALGDALTTAQLFLVLATRLEVRGKGSLPDLRRAGRSQFARSLCSDTS